MAGCTVALPYVVQLNVYKRTHHPDQSLSINQSSNECAGRAPSTRHGAVRSVMDYEYLLDYAVLPFLRFGNRTFERCTLFVR